MRYALVLTVLAVIALSACTASETPSQDDGMNVPAPDEGNDAAGTVPEGSENAGDFDDTAGPDVVIDMVGGNWYFEVDGERNPTIRVEQGDLVRVNFESIEGYHDFVIDELGVASEQIETDGETFVEFVADIRGSYLYYCSVGNHRERGMEGQLIVE